MTDFRALIGARGESRRFPGKNIVALMGKPLIAWTIEAALQSGVLGSVLVSTDDESIAQLARKWGAETPFLRPSQLAGDESQSVEMAIHAIQWLESNRGEKPEYVMLLQPTSPLRTAEDVDEAIDLTLATRAESVVSIYEAPVDSCDKHVIDPSCKLFEACLEHKRVKGCRRDRMSFALNGAIYIVRRTVMLERRTFVTENTVPFFMPLERSIDIDTPSDLELARRLMERKYKE
ncbi:cytidylyltransferase domain-containing protein [Thermodesulfobacteriota bacterium]